MGWQYSCTVVLAEASSYGIPTLATKVGGIPIAIEDGKNGYTLMMDETASKYCDYIERLLVSKNKYFELALSSYEEYLRRLNWPKAGRKVVDLLKEYCN